MLVHLRGRVNQDKADSHRLPTPEATGMAAAAWAMRGRRRWSWLLRAARLGRLARVSRLSRSSVGRRLLPPPLSSWVRSRDVPEPPQQSFRDWWAEQG
jgi:L-lactate dehydrogenase complex protein LldF